MNATMANPLKLTDIEWTTCWMAIRYAVNRRTIAAATLPADIIRAYGQRFTKGQKAMLVRDLKEEEEYMQRMGKTAFGNPDIDRPHWLRFMTALDEAAHYEVELTDGTTCTVFEANEKVVPLGRYMKEPLWDWYIPRRNIKRRIHA